MTAAEFVVPVDPAVAEGVRSGVAWLDANYPGWPERITRPVVMSDPTECVLGQVVPTELPYGVVASGFNAAMHLHPDAFIHTFDGVGALGFGPRFGTNMPGKQQYELLETLWGRVIQDRRAAAAL